MAKTLLLFFLFLQITSFIAFAEELETLHHKPATPHHSSTKSPIHKPLASPSHHKHSPFHAPSHVHTPLHPPHPAKPPTHHHHQHQHHSPSPTPSHIHPPLHPRHTAKPPTHHHQQHSPAHSPIKSPVHTPLHPPHPAKPPTHHRHQHHSPSPAPSHVHTPLHPRHPAKPPTHYHHHSPAHAPIKPPVHKPLLPPHSAKSPIHHHPPAHAPTHTHVSRNLIAVEGVVYVKSCNHTGVDTLKGATPLPGAIVKLQCNNTKYKLVLKAKTNKKGYFYIGGPKNITGYSTRHCNIVLDSAPKVLKPSNLHGGVTGALLKLVKRSMSKGVYVKLFSVGPFAFEPKCHH